MCEILCSVLAHTGSLTRPTLISLAEEFAKAASETLVLVSPKPKKANTHDFDSYGCVFRAEEKSLSTVISTPPVLAAL